MKRIHNDVSRRATFGKRRRGLLKKARELAVLCGVDLGLLVFDDDGAGKLFDYCSPNTRSVLRPFRHALTGHLWHRPSQPQYWQLACSNCVL